MWAAVERRQRGLGFGCRAGDQELYQWPCGDLEPSYFTFPTSSPFKPFWNFSHQGRAMRVAPSHIGEGGGRRLGGREEREGRGLLWQGAACVGQPGPGAAVPASPSCLAPTGAVVAGAAAAPCCSGTHRASERGQAPERAVGPAASAEQSTPQVYETLL